MYKPQQTFTYCDITFYAGLTLSRKEAALAKGRARKKLDELERLLEVAKKNYVQLGGQLSEERKRLKEDMDSKRY